MKISPKASFMKKGLFVGVAVVSILAGATGPAAANAPGTGTFVGHEHIYEEAVLVHPPTFCAQFAAGTDHHLEMEGTFHGTLGVGTASYTATESYYANPVGTYSDAECTTTPAGVAGDMTIDFAPWSCSGTGSFQRQTNSVYTLEFVGSCTNGTDTYNTEVTFTGAMEPCDPLLGCPVVHLGSMQTESAQALMEGVYDQRDA